jgi:hypothetical protein
MKKVKEPAPIIMAIATKVNGKQDAGMAKVD